MMKELAILGMFLTSVYGTCICGNDQECEYTSDTMQATIDLDASVIFDKECKSFKTDTCKTKLVAITYAGQLIPTKAFYCNGMVSINMAKIESFVAPNAISIEYNAFSGCQFLTYVDFPSATNIAISAFANCYNLKVANFSSATNIGTSAFLWCPNLKTVNINSYNGTDVSKDMFSCNALETISAAAALEIKDSAFSGCAALTTANFPSATIIGNSAFALCGYLSHVFLSAPHLIIKDNAFENCTSLKTIAIPVNTTIGTTAFENSACNELMYSTDSVLCDCKPSSADTMKELLACAPLSTDQDDDQIAPGDGGTPTGVIIGIVGGVLGGLLLIGMAFMISTRQSKSTNVDGFIGI